MHINICAYIRYISLNWEPPRSNLEFPVHGTARNKCAHPVQATLGSPRSSSLDPQLRGSGESVPLISASLLPLLRLQNSVQSGPASISSREYILCGDAVLAALVKPCMSFRASQNVSRPLGVGRVPRPRTLRDSLPFL